MDAGRLVLVCGVLALGASAAQGQGTWTSEPAVQQRLAAGEVVVSAPREVDPSHPRGEVACRRRVRIQNRRFGAER